MYKADRYRKKQPDFTLSSIPYSQSSFIYNNIDEYGLQGIFFDAKLSLFQALNRSYSIIFHNMGKSDEASFNLLEFSSGCPSIPSLIFPSTPYDYKFSRHIFYKIFLVALINLYISYYKHTFIFNNIIWMYYKTYLCNISQCFTSHFA